MSTISAETIQKHEAAKAEQARLDAWFQSKEGPDGDLPPGMTREEYNKWQLGDGKLNEQRALDQVDGSALLALRAEDRTRESDNGEGSKSIGGSTIPVVVRFGKDANQVYHAFRHIDALGLDRLLVQSTIETHFVTVAKHVVSGQPFNQIVQVGGHRLQYTAFVLADGTFNIGRIHEK